jgi:hypothetical protein
MDNNTARLQGLKQIVGITRQIVPPQLDFVVLIFRPTGEQIALDSVMFPDPTRTPVQQYERAKLACKEFIEAKPTASFNPQN